MTDVIIPYTVIPGINLPGNLVYRMESTEAPVADVPATPISWLYMAMLLSTEPEDPVYPRSRPQLLPKKLK